ncbi:MAG: hypothetical protein WA865_03435 [Spirulinaceae cyanobacterium]
MKTAIKEFKEIRKSETFTEKNNYRKRTKLLIPRKILLEKMASPKRLIKIAKRFRGLPVIREFALLSNSGQIDVPEHRNVPKEWPRVMQEVVVYDPLLLQINDCLESAQVPEKDFGHCFSNAVKICANASDQALSQML